MTLQQINLYQSQFKDKTILLSAVQIATIFILLILFVLAYSLVLQTQENLVAKQNKVLLTQQQDITQEIQVLKQKLELILSTNKYDVEMKQVRYEINARRKVLKFVETNQFFTGKGYSVYLTSLADISTRDVWLEDIQISEDNISIKGSALRAEQVPVYFNKFRDELVFQGQKFDVFYINRPDKRDWKINFVIQTQEDQESEDG